MTRKTLRFMNVNDENLLSREDMRSFLAGNQGCGEHQCGGGDTCNCLICYTPGGVEEWCRSCSGDANTICQGIYPAYGSDSVSGNWGIC